MTPDNNSGGRAAAMPQVYHDILPRRGIAEIIESTSLSTAVCIIAPYGCGKTLAVISWLGSRQAVWLNMDPKYMTDPDAALEAPAFGADENNERILVIDNFHLIRDKQLLRSMKDFIFARLGRWRVIVLSRVELPPVFNDLMLKRHIRLITTKELCFAAHEIADYFKLNGCAAKQTDILRLKDETEGWPAAINVALTVYRGGSVVYGETARTYIYSFFDSEIWEALDVTVKDFLMKTSILDELTSSSCHAVTDIGATLPVLNWLFLNGIFVTKQDEGDVYQYHSVFRDYLKEKLRNSPINEAELNKKLAWWLFEKGESAKAFTYFFKSGDMYGVNLALKTLAPTELGLDKYLELIGCIRSLDVDELKPYPIIVAKMAFIHYALGEVSEMQRLYAIFQEWIEPGVLPVSPKEYAEYVWEAGWLCYMDPNEDVLNNKKHEQWCNYKNYVPHLEELHFSRWAVMRFPSMLSGIRDYTSAVLTIEPFLKDTERDNGNAVLTDKRAIMETYLILAEYCYETERFEKAEEIVRPLMIQFEQSRATDLYFICVCILVKIMRAGRRTDETGALAARLEAMIIGNNHQFLLPNFHAFAVRNNLARGQIGFTEVFEEENKGIEYKLYFYLIYRHITLARGLISTKAYNEALLLVGKLELLCEKYNRVVDLIETRVLTAVALFAQESEQGACRALRSALELARSPGYIRLFSDDAKDIWPVLNLIRKQDTNAHTKQVVASCKKALAQGEARPRAKKYTHIELTKTELKILKQLQKGLSYEEIAVDNNIRISTVKSHAHSIYSKLNVDNKTAAVLEAQSRGIL